jgi:hypothetical protein
VPKSKIKITIHSQAGKEAVEEKLARLKRTRLARECAKLDRSSERALAEEGFSKKAPAAPESVRACR